MIPKIGDLHEGGIVYYIDESVGKGLICSVSNPDFHKWMSGLTVEYPSVGGTSQELWTGQENTRKIVEYQGTSLMYAARYCAEYSFAGFNDWYLPSVEELKLMFYHREMLGMISGTWFWSSSELNVEDSYIVVTSSEDVVSTSKKYADYSVKPIRTFTFEPEGPNAKALISTKEEIKRHNSAVAVELEIESVKSFLDDADFNHIIPAIGQATFDLIIDAKPTAYNGTKEFALLLLLQKAAVNFALGYYVNSGAVNISNAGISVTKSDKRLPASDKKLVALRRDCFEAAYGALEKAVDFLENNLTHFEAYAASNEHKANRAFFINNSKDFQSTGVNIGNSAQLYQVLKTYLPLAESNNIEPLLGMEITNGLREKIISGSASDKEKLLIKKIQQCVAFFATAEAITYQALSLEADGVFVKSETVGGISGNTQNKSAPELRLLQQAMNRLVMKGESQLESLRKFMAANKADYNFTPPTPVILNDPNEDMNIYFI